MNTFKKYLDWHEKSKKTTGGVGKTTASGGKVLGKRSAGKQSAASGKASKGGKRSAK